MNRIQKKYLYDISESIRIIFEDYLRGIDTYEQYQADLKTQDAVERRLIIIAEALNRIRRIGLDLPFGDKIINRRNSITHQYDQYNPDTI